MFSIAPSLARSSRIHALSLLAVAGLSLGLLTDHARAQFGEGDGGNLLVVEKKASIQIPTPSHNMGTVLQTDRPEFEFTFKNTGNGTLEVFRVQPTCGCTVADLEKKIYAPGESGAIKIKYDPTGKRGAQHKQVHVFSNDPDYPDIALTIEAVVEPVVFIDPPVITFNQIAKGEGKTMTVKITGRPKDFAATLATVSRSDLFSVKILDTKAIKQNDKDMRETSVEVTLLPNAPIGRVTDSVSIRTNDPLEPMVTCAINGFINGDLKTEPSVLSFGVVKPGEKFETEIKVVSRGGKPFKIVKAEVKQPSTALLSVSFTPVDPSNPTVYTLKASGVATTQDGQTTPTPFQGQLVITTDVDREETMEIPFFAQLRMINR